MCFLFQSVASPPTSSSKSGSSFSLNPLHIPSTPLPPSNLETLWRDGPRSFHCARPGLKGGAGGPTCQGQPSRGWEAGLPQQHASGGAWRWGVELWVLSWNWKWGGWLQELQGKSCFSAHSSLLNCAALTLSLPLPTLRMAPVQPWGSRTWALESQRTGSDT